MEFPVFYRYLKKVEQRLEDVTTYLTLGIPNLEVRYIYQNTILDRFNTRIRQKEFTGLYKALQQKDTLRMEKEISQNLMETISFECFVSLRRLMLLNNLFRNILSL